MLLPFSTIPSSFDLGLFYGSPHSKTSKPAAHIQKQSKPESKSDSSKSETEELFYPRYMLFCLFVCLFGT